MLKVGDQAPAWKGFDQDGTLVSSSDFAGKWLLLYFYPQDDTPGCTLEACGFRDNYAALGSRISIVGVSKDSQESHRAFIEKYQLPFSLIADTDKEVIRTFGADGILFPKRVTFLIDPTNVIQKTYHGFDAKDHADIVGKDLEAFGV
ncbi:MAG: peroxiredoxin [Candidatus Peribacteraceae bacterium]|nr:peroxiredoxin [Candidatus Peribacteraceae bacterium]MBP9850731.1 peroxiredoxin [Candidatus Peribacteraceae bacterium]